ncbi:MAG TPA: hypothetical protein VLM05_02380, partial [Mycobacteriales bacterium]|nr:hypothetical protein [Mycobacteriales bacterium]
MYGSARRGVNRHAFKLRGAEQRALVAEARRHSQATRAPGWHPTLALTRAVVLGGVLLLLAVLVRRPDLVVLAAPLLLGAGIGLAGRPTAGPRLSLAVPA